jgi:hypothetical protein
MGASGHASGRTGLSACIFFAYGKKGYRFNPLRWPNGYRHLAFWQSGAFSAEFAPIFS